jgi:osmotically-inducible protein OsmY
MSLDFAELKRSHCALPIVAALALGLAGCGEKPAPPPPPAPVVKVAPKKDEAAAKAAAEKAAAEKAAQEKAAEEKAAADAKAKENSALADKVKSALAADKVLRKMTVDVSADDGTVTLFGTADTRAHLQKAEKAAAKVEGVKSVNNQLKLVAGS